MPILTDTIVIAGRDEKTRTHLRLVAMGIPDAFIIGEAADLDGLSALARGLEPDLIVLTADFGDPAGLDTALELKAANIDVKILVVSAFGQPEFVLVVDSDGIETLVFDDDEDE